MSQLKLVRKSQGQGTELQCYNPECNYVWEYRGRMLYGCCPSCRHNVKVKEGRIRFLESQAQSGNKAEERSS
jgi:hypothetical protein